LPVHRSVVGSFVEGRFRPTGRLSVNAGLRVDHIERDALDASPFSSRPAFPADIVNSINPRVATSWYIREAASGAWSWTRVRANVATGIRPPDAFEITFTDNPALEPERSRSFDVGIEQGLLDARVLIEATWFANRYDDLIVTVGGALAGASRYRSDNIANARARGLELVLSLRPHLWLDVRTGYTYLDTEVLAVDGTPGQVPSPYAPGDWLLRRPRHQGWIDATSQFHRLSAFARFGARGRVLDVDPSFGSSGGTLIAPGYAVADLGASVSLLPKLTIFARVTNTFDRAYEEAFGFPSPGRAFIGGVRIAASR
jgi:outer membrane receptor protein involved in Fe transport